MLPLERPAVRGQAAGGGIGSGVCGIPFADRGVPFSMLGPGRCCFVPALGCPPAPLPHDLRRRRGPHRGVPQVCLGNSFTRSFTSSPRHILPDLGPLGGTLLTSSSWVWPGDPSRCWNSETAFPALGMPCGNAMASWPLRSCSMSCVRLSQRCHPPQWATGQRRRALL